MNRKTKPGIKDHLLTFLLLNAGLWIYAFSLNFFCTPNHFVFGGTTGISIILSTIFPDVSVSGFMWICNAAFMLLGLCFLGKQVMGWTLYASIMISLYSSIVEHFFPMSRPVTNDPFLEMCFAVALPGIASAMIFNIGASTGGTEIPAMVLQKFFGLEIGKAITFCDLGTVLWAAWIFGPAKGLYCVLGLVLRNTIVDLGIEGLNRRKVCTVISQQPEALRRFILQDLNRSATEQQVTGAYSQESRIALLVVLTPYETVRLRNFLRQHDPDSFLTIVSSSEIIGKGFRTI